MMNNYTPTVLPLPARFDGSYHQALDLYRSPTSGRLPGELRLCLVDAINGELRARSCPWPLGISGLSLVSADVLTYLTVRASKDGLAWFPRGITEIQERTGHGQHAVRHALRELTGEVPVGPPLVQMIRGRAVSERIYQLLDVPLTAKPVGPVRRAPIVRGSSTNPRFSTVTVTVESSEAH